MRLATVVLSACVLLLPSGVVAQSECGSAEQFQRRVDEVNAACCGRLDDCSSGAPSTCSQRCGAVLVPFIRRCVTQLQALAPDFVQPISAAAALCTDDGPVDPCTPNPCPGGGMCTPRPADGVGHRRLQQENMVAVCRPTGPVQTVGYSGMPAIDDSYETSLTVVAMSTSQPGYTTYRVAVQFGPDALDVYAVFGVPDDPLQIPPAFQVPAPFGSNFGPINPAFVPIMPAVEFDSYLTIGVDGPATTRGALSSIGIDFDSWDETTGIDTEDGALFFMDPDHGAKNEPVVFAQLTVRSGSRFRGRISVQGRSVGTSGPDSIGDEDWEVSGMTFDERGSTGILRPPAQATTAALFAGSRLITDPIWAEWLARQIGVDLGRQGFALCFSTFTDYKDDASAFHAQCDSHQRTVVVARNSLPTGARRTFGGYAALPWDCASGDYCHDPAGADNFLFELRPNHLYERYDATSEGSYQWAAADSALTGLPGDWPNFGRHEDLNIGYGYGDPPGAVLARCNQGTSYHGRPSEICGGGYNTWNARGETDLEVWYITDR